MHSDITSRPRSSGDVRYDTAARSAAADDFRHLVHHTPRLVVLPRSADDVAEAIREAGQRFDPDTLLTPGYEILA